MKKTLLLFIVSALIITACSSVKTTQEAINTGNYEKAIRLAIDNLKKNKVKEKHQPYVYMLQEAFEKSSKRDHDKIAFLKQDRNPENLEAIYNLYNKLNQRQEKIKPLLPLPILNTGKNAVFNFKSYDSEIIGSKNELSNFLLDKAKQLLNNNNKQDFRKAYDDLRYLDRINPNFKNTRTLTQKAHEKGTDYVFVELKNDTEKIIPKRLEEDLLNFDTYGLDDLWTVYHAKKDKRIRYDFALELNLRNIEVSPEQVREKQIIKERQVKDGYKYLLDDKGNQVKDSLGNKIKVDNLVNVRCELYQFTQFKTSRVTGEVKYYNFYTKQIEQRFPIQSEFVFEHIYANYKGDKRALETSLLDLLKVREVRFPTNEQMVYDTGTDLKAKLKYIITRNKFR